MVDRTLALERVRGCLEAAGQAHVLRFWPELGEQDRQRFLQELSQLRLEGLREHCEAAVEAARCPAASLDRLIQPFPPQLMGSATRSGPEAVREWEQLGECDRRSRRVLATTPFSPSCLSSSVEKPQETS